MALRRSLVIVGGGLAGCEAAWQAARRGVGIVLYEMRPQVMTPAHETGDLAELVCSNSLGSNRPDRASGLLKRELRSLGSLVLACADATAVPAGTALAVGRGAFAREVTRAIEQHPLIRIVRAEITEIPPERPAVIATGPLTSDRLAQDLVRLTGETSLYFYDAMAPIITHESVDLDKVFRASRYGRDEGDYLNCPMTQDEYGAFVEALVTAETHPLRDFEREDKRFFEACLPVEVLAARGQEALAYGPLRPTGLIDPRTGRRPYAVVQLRQDDRAGTLYNLVGFQTNLTWSEQKRVFSMIPGLEKAEWVRYGQMHRNTYLNGPALLDPSGRFRAQEGLFFAGQIVGTEGYVGSTASGLIAGINAARVILGKEPITAPGTTMLGALMRYISSATEVPFQPMKPNFGLLPPLDPPVRKKRARYEAFAERSQRDLDEWLASAGALDDTQVDTCAIESARGVEC